MGQNQAYIQKIKTKKKASKQAQTPIKFIQLTFFMDQKQLTQVPGNIYTLDQKLGILHGTDLGPLHVCVCVCYSCVAWSVCKAPSTKIRVGPCCLDVFWEPVP